MQKRHYAFVMLGIEALSVVGVVYFLVTLDFVSLAWSASIAVAIPAWVLAVKAPTTCGVTTQKGGRCSRKVNGHDLRLRSIGTRVGEVLRPLRLAPPA